MLNFLSSALLAVASRETPANPTNLTVYHVNQINYTGLSNMNSADALGDAFFKFRTVLSINSCLYPKPHGMNYPGMCDNPETFSNDLTITKVVLEVDSDFGEYGECNVCDNGTVPFTNPPVSCEDGTYHCRCGKSWGHSSPCPARVGRENITELFGRFPIDKDTPPTTYWLKNLVDRTGGMWYSTLDIGQCDGAGAESCEWKIVERVKRINATCQDGMVSDLLQENGKECFAGCGSQRTNASSPCFANCYYTTLLGSGSGNTYPVKGGLSRQDILDVWDKSFVHCPSV